MGPSIRAYGLCLDGLGRVICEPMAPELDLIFIPQSPGNMLAVASLFAALPDTLRSIALERKSPPEGSRRGGDPRDGLPETLRDRRVWERGELLPGVKPPKLVFLAEHVPTKQVYIVKYTRR